MKIKKLLIALMLFFVVLSFVYIIHLNFFKVDVVFYSAIFDGVLSAILVLLIIYRVKFFSIFSNLEKIQTGIIFILLGYSFAISVPTVIDRSLSFYLLEKIQQRGGGIKHNAFEDVFVKEYMVEHRLVDIRLTEQLSSGTIEIINGCVKLTKKGNMLANISRYFRQNFLPKIRLIAGKYTDDLTNPFKNTTVDNRVLNYICE